MTDHTRICNRCGATPAALRTLDSTGQSYRYTFSAVLCADCLPWVRRQLFDALLPAGDALVRTPTEVQP